ncbi:MAG: hypothetical protein RI513_05255 [Balneolaceae bacterium]|nr:hypothetical protein [Balneolaceae bacterium]MDR9446936.1 hypothetical protein [Balneolaceae bacterium]
MRFTQRYSWFALLTALVIFLGQLLGSWHEATHHGALGTTGSHASECSSADSQFKNVELDIDHSTCPVCVLNQGNSFDSQLSVSTTLSISDNVVDVASVYASWQDILPSSPRAPPFVS